MPTKLRPVFGDKVVSPTELARDVRKITVEAFKHPITIHRSEGDLAMMPRQDVAELAAAAQASETMVHIVRSFLSSRRRPKELPVGWEWLAVFDQEDIEDFVSEYVSAVADALSGLEEWDYPEAVVHEWQESARALHNQALLAEVAAFRGITSEEEAARLPAEELRKRLSKRKEPHAR